MTSSKKRARFRVSMVVLVVSIAATAGFIAYITNKDSEPAAYISPPESSITPQQQPEPATMPPAFNSAQYATTDPASIWFIVNKNITLAPSYIPADLVVPNVPLQAAKSTQEMSLRRDVSANLEAMFAVAKEQSVQLKLASGYRSYELQEYYYNSLVRSLGAEEANKVSAKPGTSEHQTGLVADIASYSNDVCHLETCFGTMPEGQWLANNAHNFGFIIRYPQSKTAVTGYSYEPWHVRYVGTELATELQKTGQALEEFFGVQ